jgi:hypothetical protein
LALTLLHMRRWRWNKHANSRLILNPTQSFQSNSNKLSALNLRKLGEVVVWGLVYNTIAAR